MRIKNIAGQLALLVLCLTTTACSDPGNSVKQADAVADSYYQALKNKNFDKAASLFMDTKAAPRAQWLDEIRSNHDKLGDLQSFQAVGQPIVNTVYSGTRYTLHYKTQYANATAHETLILFDGVSTFSGGNGNVLLIESLIIRPSRPGEESQPAR